MLFNNTSIILEDFPEKSDTLPSSPLSIEREQWFCLFIKVFKEDLNLLTEKWAG
jgi:hypothetical protein